MDNNIYQKNYKSDFDFLFAFPLHGAMQVENLNDLDFLGVLYSDSSPTSFFEFGHNDNKWKNCELTGNEIEDNSQRYALLRVICGNHNLPPGELTCKLTVYFKDNDFPNGIRKQVCKYMLPIKLVTSDCECDKTSLPIVQLLLPYIKGDKLTYADLTENDKADLRAPIQKKVDSVEKELETHIEESGRKFIGVWDELDNIKELLASVNSREVNTLLEKLGFTESDIEEYIYANLHLGLGLTMDDLRESAWRWEHFDELDKPVSFPVLPKMSLELEDRFGGFKDFLESVDADSVKYLPQIVMSEDCLVMEKFGIEVGKYFKLAKYHGGINYLNEKTPMMLGFYTQHAVGIGTIEGNIAQIHANAPFINLRYIKGIRSIYRGIFFKNAFRSYTPTLSNITGVELRQGTIAESAFAADSLGFGYEPLNRLRIGNWDFNELSSTYRMFQNQVLSDEYFEFTLDDFCTLYNDVWDRPSPYHIFYYTVLKNCTITLPNAENSAREYYEKSKGLALLGEMRAWGVTRIIAPKLQYVDLGSFYSLGNHDNQYPNGLFIVECPEARVLNFDLLRFISVIPAYVGKNLIAGSAIFLREGIDKSLYDRNRGNDDIFGIWLNKALDTWYDRRGAGLGPVIIYMSKRQGELLDEEVLLGLTSKGYTVTVDSY